MEFRKLIGKTDLFSPLFDFERDTQSIEYRKDPLTEVWCRINVKRAERVRQAQRGEVDLGEIIDKTKKGCFFCPENIRKDTPLFPPHIWKEGRIWKGGCHLFPNLFPFAKHHAVATMTTEHFLDLDGFEAEMILDNLKATLEFMLSVHRSDPKAKYPMYNWNHLPPSAASIVHPHVQVLVDEKPTPYIGELLEKSRGYHHNSGRNYWADLVEEEKRIGERYIGREGSVSVLASYAPQGNREIQLVFRVSNLLELNEREMANFAGCLEKILHGYKEMGVGSFNLTTFSGPVDEKLDHYALHAKIISRPLFQPYYTNDTGFLERFHYEAVIETRPEDVAEQMRVFFEK